MSLIILLSDQLKKMIIDTEYNMLTCFDINLQLKKKQFFASYDNPSNNIDGIEWSSRNYLPCILWCMQNIKVESRDWERCKAPDVTNMTNSIIGKKTRQ